MKYARSLFLLLCAGIMISCNTVDIKINGNPETVKSWRKFAILEVMISPTDSPIFPLIDAGIYNASFNDIYDDITILHEKNCEKVVTHLASIFEKYSKTEVLYGSDLFALLTKEKLEKAGITTYPPILDNKNFPKISLPPYALNFFNFSDIYTPHKAFSKGYLEAIQPKMKKLCEIMNVDGLLVGTVAVHTTEVGVFGISGSRVLYIDLLFFDRDGKKICSGYITSKANDSSPKDIIAYDNKLNEYYWLTDKFLRKLYLNEELNDDEDAPVQVTSSK